LEGLKKGLAMMHAALPDQNFAVEDIVADGDMVSIRGTITATFSGKGPLFGVPASGKYAKWVSLMTFKIKDGKIVERWVNADTWGMLQQIGVLPAPQWDMSGMLKEAAGDAKQEKKNKAVITEFIQKVWGERNLDAVAGYFAKDGGIAGGAPAGGGILVKPDMIKMIGGGVFQAFPDFKAEIEFIMADGDKVVARIAEKGTQKGDYMGVPASNKEVAWSDTFHFVMKDKKIVNVWIQSDVMGLMNKIGGFKPQVVAKTEVKAEKPAEASIPATVAEQNKAAVERFIEEFWNQKKFDLAADLVAPEHFSSSLPMLPKGPDGMKLIANIVAGAEKGIYPDLQREVKTIFAGEDMVGAVWVNRGTQKGTYMSVPPTNKKVEWVELGLFKFKDGKMIESWYRPDELGLVKELVPEKLDWLHM
jgi:predicted ester cyclase